MRILKPVMVFRALASVAAQEAPKVHFYHVRLNATYPAAAVAFYTVKFHCDGKDFAGREAVHAQNSWLVFTKMKEPPPSEIVSAIWHSGWSAEDMPAAYRKQTESGTGFQMPITDISDLALKPPGDFFFAYVDGPDHALIELNTAANYRFGQVHRIELVESQAEKP